MKFFDFNFDKLQKFLEKLTQVLLLVTSVSLLLGVLFGPDSAFIGAVYQNFSQILTDIGQDGVIATCFNSNHFFAKSLYKEWLWGLTRPRIEFSNHCF
ncbi:MAG: hypothetical protein CM15mP19_05470 [Gammaproteobacteria bacterium]|nr:MAG: hypothetical protein CM15mP19_05470 [Gammaproteobacteria bacterium]